MIPVPIKQLWFLLAAWSGLLLFSHWFIGGWTVDFDMLWGGVCMTCMATIWSYLTKG